MLKLQIIVGSTREGRHADSVVHWLTPVAKAHGAFDVEVLDLRDWPLPFFQETIATVGDFKNPTYSQPVVKKWNQKIAEGDAFLFVTSEYNHSVPGVLKNAIDSVFLSFGFRHKPAGMVGYSVGAAAGSRAVEHLAQIGFETEMHALRDSVLIGLVHEAFRKDDGAPVNSALNIALKITLDDLAWWGGVLKPARATQLPPGNMRMRAALAAKA
ncbi:MAG: NAD(P)H-dependent oxidoreductase [Polyangiaceae bacterium]|jgi:NAD(P)H-dependent FMN reductase